MLNSTNVDESSHERKTWTDDFPYHMQLSEFAQRSISPGQNCSINATHNIKNYILNGANGNENLIHEVVLNKNNIIDCKSLVKDYNKPNADVDKMGTPDGLYTHSFLLNNDKYLMVCHAQNGMNVYDIENDKWLLEKSCHILTYGSSVGARMLLLNDEIIVVSSEKYLVFYLVPNVTDRITEPIFLFKYLLKTTKLTYNGHGMCCLQFNYNEKEISKDKAKKTYVGSYKYDKIYNFKILLFGGQYNKKFTASFLTLDISISLPNNFILLKDENFQNEDSDMDETLIVKEELTDMNDIKCVNFDSKNLNEHERHWFGFECVWNIKNEAIVIVIGGNPGFDHGASDEFREIEKRAVYLYNTNTNEMIQKKNFLPFECGWYPATKIVTRKGKDVGYKSIVVLQHQSCFVFKIFIHCLSWDMARIIWIGFEKNDKNDKCLIGLLPKDIVKFILSLVGAKIADTLDFNHSCQICLGL